MAKTESQKQKKEPSLPVLAVTNIKPENVGRIFGISAGATGSDWTLSAEERLPIPSHLRDVLRDYHNATGGSPENEAHMCTCIDAVLLTTLAMAKRAQHAARYSDSATSAESVHFQFEKDMKLPWVRGNTTYLISGQTDYSLWNGNPGTMEANMLVCEAKQRGQLGKYQALVYMSMLHHARKAARRDDTSVFGIATDSYDWEFLHLNNDSKYSACTYHWENGQGIEIISTISKIIKHATDLSGDPPLSRKRTLEEMSGLEFTSLT
ncbi:hypothetical protein BO78DRAFT_403053 [Aspergillus sclerotiicarbonarius CBS 121057]|uniref:Uncharacterized protein n=1 Tax=Aspergillus sclerotiicarbonarius (strain CBS 121057 / IBT 28362) TaxID=1448318 RepID=A0A319EN10_ASPSB|nr:hypothetical protein BO78DRAFT_403053 [Aspergillus sclerotiicarbonarius CBS 121057]